MACTDRALKYGFAQPRYCRYLVSLATADLSVSVLVMLPSALMFQHCGWVWGSTACKVWITLDVLLCSASIYSIIGISIDRFLALYKPFL